MKKTARLRIGDINKNLICLLCGGYYIDATSIIECLHSFCRTCIVTYLKTSKTCPVCDTTVHKTRPHQNIRSDKLLQDLVYKLVPGLYKDEMKRRREFYTEHYEDAPKRPGEERGDEMSDRFIYTEEEKISLALHYCPESGNERTDFRRVFTTKEELRARMERKIQKSVDVRYLQCKGAVTIGHLKKFVKLKYRLPCHYQVDMFCNEEMLRETCTLCDVACMFTWRRKAPLKLHFSIYETTIKKIRWGEEIPRLMHSTPLDTWSIPRAADLCHAAVDTCGGQAVPAAAVPFGDNAEELKPNCDALLSIPQEGDSCSRSSAGSQVLRKGAKIVQEMEPSPASLKPLPSAATGPSSSSPSFKDKSSCTVVTQRDKLIASRPLKSKAQLTTSARSSSFFTHSNSSSSVHNFPCSPLSKTPVGGHSHSLSPATNHPTAAAVHAHANMMMPEVKPTHADTMMRVAKPIQAFTPTPAIKPTPAVKAIPAGKPAPSQVTVGLAQQQPASIKLPFTQPIVSSPYNSKTWGTHEKKAKFSPGKRPANTPIPIAPAPAKVPNLNTSVAHMIKLDTCARAGTGGAAVAAAAAARVTHAFSLLPASMTRTGVGAPKMYTQKATKNQAMPQTGSAPSGMFNMVTLGRGSSSAGVMSTSVNGKPALYAMAHPSPRSGNPAACSGPVRSTPTYSPLCGIGSQSVTRPTFQTSATPPAALNNSFSKFSSASSKVVASKTTLSLTSTLPLSSSSSSSSSSSNGAHTVPTTSISSPTPATSASPTPAAVPVQQSQTQPADALAEAAKAGDNNRMGDNNRITGKETVVSQGHGLPPNSAKAVNNCSHRPGQQDRSVAPSTPATSNTSPTTSTSRVNGNGADLTSSPLSLDSSFSSSSHSSPELTSPSSSGRGTVSASAQCRKQPKQKKIADIANTLHRRMNETLQNQNNRHPVSPDGGGVKSSSSSAKISRSESPGVVKPLLSLPLSPPVRNGLALSPGTGLTRQQERGLKPSLTSPADGAESGKKNENSTPPLLSCSTRGEEPLNLVKRDQAARLTNGLFAPPVVK